MVNHWIFKVKDDIIDGDRKEGIEIYLQRMSDRFWGLNPKASSLRYLEPNDKVVFYLAGFGEYKFLGTCLLDSRYYELSKEEKTLLGHSKFFRPSHGVRLKQVNIWGTPKPIKPLIKAGALKFIADPSIWGSYLQGSIRSISPEDYETIAQGTESETRIRAGAYSISTNSMLKVVEYKAEIDKAQVLFMQNLGKFADRMGIISVGYQGESQKLRASWSKKLDIWWVGETSGNRYWNAFGTGEPEWNSGYSHSITCEINPPFQGINRSIAGVFAKDPNGKLYLLHRGKIGGGKKGIGKTKFENEYRGVWVPVEDGSEFSRLALIASFESSRFGEQVADFVHQVERIKSKNTSNNKFVSLVPNTMATSFREEFQGTKKFNVISKEIEAQCDHGIVVNTLAKRFENEGMTVGSNLRVDLFTVDSNNNLKALFEVKTESTSTRIYEAIGQLFYNATDLSMNCKLVAVFPKSIDDASRKVFHRLNIQCLTYEWVNDIPSFVGFNAKSFI
jgi:hypothetical protein